MPNEFANQLSKFISLSNSSTLKVLLNNKTSKFDLSLIVIWLIAIATIVLGALWTKLEFRTSLSKLEDDARQNSVDSSENLVDNKSVTRANSTEPATIEGASSSKKTQDSNNDDQLTTISISYISIFVLLLFVVGILLLLYFFYDYMSE
jgi:hypothetical protein